MRVVQPTVPHRIGRRTNFIPALEGRPAKWAEVLDTAADPGRLAEVSGRAVATILRAGPSGDLTVETADLSVLRNLSPDDLFTVRRPASHQGMTNYISRVVVPSERHAARAVWCESFNELAHLRDILIRQPAQVSTQSLRLEWVLPSGVRSHIPDFLVQSEDGRTVLVDVTTTTKFDDPRLKAILRLTSATATVLGWGYEVRTELPPQRVRNLNFLHACAHDVEQDRPTARRQLRQSSGPVDVQRACEVLGGGARGYMRLWDLLAHGHAHVDLDRPIDRDTLVAFTRRDGGASWLHVL